MNKQTKKTDRINRINRQKRQLIDHVAWCIKLQTNNKLDWWTGIRSELHALFEYYMDKHSEDKAFLLDVDTIHELIYDHGKFLNFDVTRIDDVFDDPSFQETDQKQEVEA